jgi:hypothetical protein
LQGYLRFTVTIYNLIYGDNNLMTTICWQLSQAA